MTHNQPSIMKRGTHCLPRWENAELLLFFFPTLGEKVHRREATVLKDGSPITHP